MNTVLLTYYEIENTITERASSVTATWATLSQAKNDMPNHCDWYANKGTGSIYEVQIFMDVSGKITQTRKLIKRY